MPGSLSCAQGELFRAMLLTRDEEFQTERGMKKRFATAMSIAAWIPLLLVGSASAQEASKGGAGSDVALPELEAAPESGVDPDIALAFERAREQLEKGEPGAASWEIRSLFSSDDRFTVAQRGRRRAEARELLLKSAARMESEGNRSGAVRAYDAAWILGGRGVMPEYAQVLARWAREERESDAGTALYLAKRARLVDPGNELAPRLDRKINRNSYAVPAYVSAAVGVAGLVGALLLRSRLEGLRGEIEANEPKPRAELDRLVSKYRTNRTLFGVAAGLGSVGVAAGAVFFSLEPPEVHPTSPEQLPALPGGAR